MLLPPDVLWRSGQIKPYGSIPRINWAHPLSRNLVFYAYDTGGPIIDLVNGSLGKIFSSTTHLARTVSRFGTGLKYAGTATSDTVSLPVANLKVSSFANSIVPFSQAIGILQTGTGVTGAYIVSVSAANDNTGFAIGGTATTARAMFNFGNGQIDYVPSFTANVYHTLVSVATTAAAGNLYFDGGAAQAFSTTTTFANTGQQVCFNTGVPGATTAGGGANGFVFYYAGWNKAVTQAESKQLHLDPWCFLLYPEDDMFSTIVGAAAVAAAKQRQYELLQAVNRASYW